MDDVVLNDEVEIVDDQGNDSAVNSDNQNDNFSDMQDRMSGDIEPWYSESVGKVVDQNGIELTDEKGNTFNSMEKYLESTKETEKSEKTTTESTDKKEFHSFITDEITPEKFKALSEVGKDFKYSDELLPRIQTPVKGELPKPAEMKPTVRVKAMYKNWNSISVDPLVGISQNMINTLVKNGADHSVALNLVNSVIGPVLEKQKSTIENLYREEYEKAFEKEYEDKYNTAKSTGESKALQGASDENVMNLSKKYFGDYGKDALFSIINGYKSDKDFIRGPASHIMDLFTNIMNGDKQFSSQDDVNNAMKETFTKLTADSNKAAIFFDLIYNYYLGKNASKAQQTSYEDGKKAALADQQRIKQTIRKRPASITQQHGDPYEGYPKAIRAALLMNS